jgi:hypothetical protein
MNDWTFTKDEHDIWRLKKYGRTIYSVHDLALDYYKGDLADIWLEIIKWLFHKRGEWAVEGLCPGVFMKGWEDEMDRHRN